MLNNASRLTRRMTTTIGIIGAGNIGSQIARVAIAAGYDVVISNSRGPETLAELVGELGPKARAATVTQAAEAGDFVVATVPLSAYKQIPVEPLAGKIVIDTNNYYFERDGRIASLDDGTDTTSELIQRHLPASKVVKGFNHIKAADITGHTQAAGTENRRALVVSSNFDDATELLTNLYDEFGFDTVDVGPLSESWRIERDQPAYVVHLTVEQLREKLAEANRTEAAA